MSKVLVSHSADWTASRTAETAAAPFWPNYVLSFGRKAENAMVESPTARVSEGRKMNRLKADPGAVIQCMG